MAVFDLISFKDFELLGKIFTSQKRSNSFVQSMGVSGNGVAITNGDATPSPSDYTDFESTEGLTTVDRVFVISAINGDLSGVNVSVPSGFSLTVSPSSSIISGVTSNFTVRALASVWGTFSGNITITSNEVSDFVFAITASVTIITTGLVSDWDMSDVGKLFEDLSQADPAEADDPVAWMNASNGLNQPIAQATLSRRPIRKDNVQNGKTVLRFDSTDALSLQETLTITGNETILCVVKHGVTGAFGRILGVTGTAWGLYYSSVANRIQYDYNSVSALKTGGFTETDFVIATARFNGTNNIVRVNGVLGGTVGTTTAASHTYNTVGARSGFSDTLNGDIGRALVYNVALSDSQISFMESYLSVEWGVTI